ncbi:MAG: hypothetical protein OWT28_00610 [Firmicutes bacterium]|nr:hypothetical protein [Bacillota bacterium]
MDMLLTGALAVFVIGSLFFVVFRYRDTPDNTAPYEPSMPARRIFKYFWWIIPILVIGVLTTFS